jgi:hypothetical protein
MMCIEAPEGHPRDVPEHFGRRSMIPMAGVVADQRSYRIRLSGLCKKEIDKSREYGEFSQV